MDKTVELKMPGGVSVYTTFTSSESETSSLVLRFWNDTRINPIVGYDTAWGCNTNSTEPNSNKARIKLLKLCNKENDCLIINLSALTVIPQVLVKFLAVRDIRFVGVNISKELQKLKEDYGIEIRYAIELTTIAADQWDEYAENQKLKFYEEWKDFKLDMPRSKKDIPLGGVRLLSAALLGMRISSNLPSSLVSEDNETTLDFHYLSVPVYAALKIGVELSGDIPTSNTLR